MDRAARGQHFEALAQRYLESHALLFIRRNFRCRWGEIDLIMRDREFLVFVEVRFRGRGSYISGVLSIDAKKRKKLCKTAHYYLATQARAETPARIDVVSISQGDNQRQQFKWIRNAFECAAY